MNSLSWPVISNVSRSCPPATVPTKRCRPDHSAAQTTLGQGAAKRARTATQVEHPTWGQSGKSEVEVGILRPRVNEIVNLGDLSVLIVHTFVAPSPRLPQSDVTVVGQS